MKNIVGQNKTFFIFYYVCINICVIDFLWNCEILTCKGKALI